MGLFPVLDQKLHKVSLVVHLSQSHILRFQVRPFIEFKSSTDVMFHKTFTQLPTTKVQGKSHMNVANVRLHSKPKSTRTNDVCL